MSTAKTIVIALRLAEAVGDADRARTTRDTLLRAGCENMEPIERRMMIREARVAILAHALKTVA